MKTTFTIDTTKIFNNSRDLNFWIEEMKLQKIFFWYDGADYCFKTEEKRDEAYQLALKEAKIID